MRAHSCCFTTRKCLAKVCTSSVNAAWRGGPMAPLGYGPPFATRPAQAKVRAASSSTKFWNPADRSSLESSDLPRSWLRIDASSVQIERRFSKITLEIDRVSHRENRDL